MSLTLALALLIVSLFSVKDSPEIAVELPWPEDQPMVPLWPTAAHPFHVRRSRAFQLAHRGEFPVEVLRVGGRWLVRTADLRRQLGLPVYKKAA
jgi:hypothetical protein